MWVSFNLFSSELYGLPGYGICFLEHRSDRYLAIVSLHKLVATFSLLPLRPLSCVHCSTWWCPKRPSEWVCSVVLGVSDSWRPHGLQPARLLCPWDSPGKSTGVGCQVPLQGIFPTQGLNPRLLHCWWILYHLATSPFTLFFFFMLLFLFFFLLLWVDAFHFPVFVLILSSPWSALLLTVSHCVFRFTSYTFMLCDFRLALFCTFHFFAEILTWFMHCSPDFSEYVYACWSLYQAYQLPLFH